MALAQPARAQSAGYQLNRFEPPPAGDPFTAVEYPWYSATRWFAAGLTLDYAHNLLEARSAPTVLYENGTPFNGLGPTGVVAGDPRVGVRGRLFGQLDSLVSLSVSAY